MNALPRMQSFHDAGRGAEAVQTTRRQGVFTRLRSPVLAPLLAQRGLSIGFAALGSIQILAGLVHFHTFTCPMLNATGVPCPGCGASRACAALLRGNWDDVARYHLLAPLFLAAVVLFSVSAVLSDGQRRRFSAFVANIERWTGLSAMLLAAVIVYWGIRVLYAPHEFARLMRG